jgi:hypothetical protein
MSTTTRPHPPRPNAEYRWTGAKAAAFIEALARHGKVALAAREVGMTRQSAYRLRQRIPRVDDVWLKAQAEGRARRTGKALAWRGQGDAFARQGDALREGKATHWAAR